MIEAPVPPPQPIAAVLADVDGTLVTSAKAVTTRAIEAIEGFAKAVEEFILPRAVAAPVVSPAG